MIDRMVTGCTMRSRMSLMTSGVMMLAGIVVSASADGYFCLRGCRSWGRRHAVAAAGSTAGAAAGAGARGRFTAGAAVVVWRHSRAGTTTIPAPNRKGEQFLGLGRRRSWEGISPDAYPARRKTIDEHFELKRNFVNKLLWYIGNSGWIFLAF